MIRIIRYFVNEKKCARVNRLTKRTENGVAYMSIADNLSKSDQMIEGSKPILEGFYAILQRLAEYEDIGMIDYVKSRVEIGVALNTYVREKQNYVGDLDIQFTNANAVDDLIDWFRLISTPKDTITNQEDE